MKTFAKIFVLLLLVFAVQIISAQQIGNLEGINYQAVAIDEKGKEIVGMDINGKPLYNKTIGVRFTILSGSSGPVLYQETHTVLTDRYGLFSLVIGHGELTGEGAYDTLMNIPWIDADQYLKVEIDIMNDGDYKLVSLQKFMTVPYSFYTDDIADNAINTNKILNETILAEDIGTGSVETSEILDETILAEDIDTGAITTSEILNETILAEDIAIGSVETSEILNETILAEDIAPGSVETSEILDSTILNADIANGTIDLTTKVTGVLPVSNGGTGASSLTNGGILVGGGTTPIQTLPQGIDGQIPVGVNGSNPVMKLLTQGPGINVTQTADSIIISSTITGGVNANGKQSINIGMISGGSTYISPAFPVPGGGSGAKGDIVLASLDVNLKGCMLTPYFFSANTIKVAIFNGTGSNVNLGNGVIVKILVVQ